MVIFITVKYFIESYFLVLFDYSSNQSICMKVEVGTFFDNYLAFYEFFEFLKISICYTTTTTVNSEYCQVPKDTLLGSIHYHKIIFSKIHYF